jgi:hypothetical protein
VPSGGNCTLVPGTMITHDVKVQLGGALNDEGAIIGDNVHADQPAGIGIRGGSIGNDIQIIGLTGAGPGSGGDNYICNTTVGGNVDVQNGAVGAKPFVIGDPPDCSGSPSNTIGGNLSVRNNADPVDVSDNQISNDLAVENNTGGTVVANNHAGKHAKCQGNSPPATGAGNTAPKNQGCPP